MQNKHRAKIISTIAAVATCVSMALPAQAFYIEMPRLFQTVQTVRSPYGGILLVVDDTGYSTPSDQTFAPPDFSTGSNQPPSVQEPNLQPVQAPEPMQAPRIESGTPGGTCNVDGVEKPGSCDQYNTGGQAGPQYKQDGQSEPKMDQGGQNQEQQQRMQEQQQKMQGQRLKDMQREAKRLKLSLNKLESVFNSAEKKGTVIPDEIKQKLEKAKQMVQSIADASDAESLEDIDLGELGNMVRELEEARGEIVDAAQRVLQVKRGVNGMEQGVKMFDKQIVKLKKQNITVPAEVTVTLDKIKSIIAAVKSAKTWDEIQAAGFEDLQDLMQDLDQFRPQLEMLARWPQTIKQIVKDIKQLDLALKRDKAIVTKLLKKGIDLNAKYVQFETAVNKVKTARDQATEKMKAGDAETAFEILENDVFGQMEDVWQNSRVIEMMGNLGSFNSDFKRGISQAQTMIKQLKKKKLDTVALEGILSKTQLKGQEILDMLKSGNIDEDQISITLDELENLRQDFQSQVAELTGEEDVAPWEQGQQQFKPINVPPAMGNLMQQKQQPKEPNNPPQVTETAPLNP